MKKKKTLRKIFLTLGLVVATPIVLFLILAVLVYIPPVQRFIVREATSVLSDATGMRVHIGRVRLAFPLDLALGDMQAIRGRDTLVDARALRVGVRLWPLVHGRAEVNIVSLIDARLNTLDLIPDVQVSGRVGLLSAALPGGVDLGEERVLVDRVMLKNTALLVALSDTAREDTTPAAPSRWDIHLRRADIVNTSLALRMPGDSMRVGARLGRATIRHGRFDTGRSHYAVGLLALDRSAATYDVPQAMRLASGIDPNHIAVERLTLRVDSIDYDSAGRLNLNLRRLAFDERSGLSVAQLYGRVRLDTASIALPALTLALPHMPAYARLLRAAMLRTARENFVLHDRARGLTPRTVMKHIFRNSLQSCLTALGMSLPRLMAGAFVVENIFAWPGLGRLCVTAIFNRDFPVIQAYVLLMAGMFVVCNLCVDICATLLDPRRREEAAQ